MREGSKRIVLGVMILAAFTFIVSFSTLYVESRIQEGDTCGCPIPIWSFIPSLSSLGIIVGTLVYYVMSEKVEETRKSARKEVEKLLFLLPEEEREILNILMKKGEVTQATLSRDTSYSRVKIHRTVRKLEDKGIIRRVVHGKTNKIILVDELKGMLP